MKKGIHPEYVETVVTCGCGNTFNTRSTRKELKVDICNVCHPFYTGKLKFLDTAGRIETLYLAALSRLPLIRAFHVACMTAASRTSEATSAGATGEAVRVRTPDAFPR